MALDDDAKALARYASNIRAHLMVPYWLQEWSAKLIQARNNKMAKAFRQAPLIGAAAGVGLPITEERNKRSIELARKMVGRFSDDFVLNVATEIGLDECIRYNEKATALVFDCTELQLLAIGTALAACAEYRDSVVTTRKASQKRKAVRS